MIGHCSRGALLAYRAGEDHGPRRRRTARHLLACTACRRRLDRLGDIREAAAAIGSPNPPNVLGAVRARIEAGDAVLLPPASPLDSAPTRRRTARRSVAAVAVLTLVGAGAALGAFRPAIAWLSSRAPATEVPAADAPRGIGIPVPASGLRIVLSEEVGPTRLGVSTGDADLLEVRAFGASPGLRFVSGEGSLRLAGGTATELRVSVPRDAGPVEIVQGDAPVARVEGGRVLRSGHAPATSAEWTLGRPPSSPR